MTQKADESAVNVRHLQISLTNRWTLVVGQRANKSHYYEFEGIPGIEGQWSLPLTREHAQLAVREVPLNERVKNFLISILTSEVWLWG
jgi:hypothetical protein